MYVLLMMSNEMAWVFLSEERKGELQEAGAREVAKGGRGADANMCLSGSAVELRSRRINEVRWTEEVKVRSTGACVNPKQGRRGREIRGMNLRAGSTWQTVTATSKHPYALWNLEQSK